MLLPAFIAAGTIGGAIAGEMGSGFEGGLKGIPTQEAAKIQALLNQALSELEIQRAMAEGFIAEGRKRTPYLFIPLNGSERLFGDTKPDYRSLRDQGIDLVLETGVEKVGLNLGKGKDAQISVFMISRIRAIQPSDDSEIFSDTFYYESLPRTLSAWEAGPSKLREAFEKGYGEIVETSVEKIFFLHQTAIDSIWSGAKHCMLRAISPEYPGPDLFFRQWKVPRADTLRPTFKWEPFPREKDKEADRADIRSPISDVTYELKVWKGTKGAPDDLVYTRQGIPDSEHAVEIGLEPLTEYFWTVRAEFVLEGQRRVTKWSYSRLPWLPGRDPCLDNSIPLYHYYRFETPPLKGN